jgi:hypothetical protein
MGAVLSHWPRLVRDARRLGEKAEAIGDCKGALMGVRGDNQDN